MTGRQTASHTLYTILAPQEEILDLIFCKFCNNNEVWCDNNYNTNYVTSTFFTSLTSVFIHYIIIFIIIINVIFSIWGRAQDKLLLTELSIGSQCYSSNSYLQLHQDFIQLPINYPTTPSIHRLFLIDFVQQNWFSKFSSVYLNTQNQFWRFVFVELAL